MSTHVVRSADGAASNLRDDHGVESPTTQIAHPQHARRWASTGSAAP
ncbi:MAG: hypothetical protein H0X38_05425 [Planctomycetes bacterium]|nr:hypothetical protein [Planctomycetota bacterium]